ncbi:MAG: hypothetical protein IT317_01280 [Anaerolineales bacterium]|nr:hypothetical protein [Anaerolineales bacterium]
MSDMLDAQFRLREAAQASRVHAIRALVTTAEALCPSQWDAEKRAGHSPEEWPPEHIGEFVVRHTLSALQHGYLAQQTDLAAEYERTSRELTAANGELSRLKLQLQHAQAVARNAAAQSGQTAQGKHGVRAVAQASPAESAESEPAEVAGELTDGAKELEAVSPERIDAVIKVMAATGLSRSDEVRERLAVEWGARRSSSRVGLPVRAALHRGLVDTFPCIVEWPGERTRQFLVLTPAGRARAVELGVVPVESEFEGGMKLHKTADHLYLVLKTADILSADGYEAVTYLPECLQVADGEYCPDIAARKDGRIVYVECERSQIKAREAKWTRAAEANGGTIYLVTPNRKIMDAITSEIKATTGSEHKIWAFNISEHAAGSRGPNGSIWTHQR